MNTMMLQQLQLVHDEEDEDTNDSGRVDGESSTMTMTTTTITTKNAASTSNINDDDDVCCSDNQHSENTLKPSCLSPALIISLFSLIGDDDVVGIRDLITSLSTLSSTINNSNEEEDGSIDDIITIPMDIMNCVLNNFGYTPIIIAVLFGHIDTARCLLNEYGADVNIAAYNGQTALHFAVQCPLIIESIDLIQLLLDHSNNNHHQHQYLINRQDYNGNTPLHYASSEKAVRVLLQYGANVQIRNKYGEIPLHRAVQYAPYESVKELLYYPSRSRRLICSDNNFVEVDDDPNIVVNHKNNDYDYNRIHCMKSNNGLTPYDTIIHCQPVLDLLGLLDSLRRVRLFNLFNQYEQEQQQIKRYIIYSHLLSCPEISQSNANNIEHNESTNPSRR